MPQLIYDTSGIQACQWLRVAAICVPGQSSALFAIKIGISTMFVRSHTPAFRAQAASLVAIVAVTAAVYWPALRSFFVIDDFFLIAISRLIGNPLVAFTHSHIPGGMFFRPLAIAFWWLTVELAGTLPRWHYLINLVLHIGTSLALFRLILLGTGSVRSAFLATLCFACHPIAIGTSLWLADRFDLLATLFGLLAMDAAFRYRRQRGRGNLLAAFVLVIASALSKETGLACAAAIATMWFWPQPSADSCTVRRFWTPLRLASLSMAVAAALLIAWRTILLGSSVHISLRQNLSLPMILVQGMLAGCRNFPIYLAQTGRFTHSQGLMAVLGVVSLLACAGWTAFRRRWSYRWNDESIALGASALALIAAAITLQAPTMRLMTLALDLHLSAFLAAVNARLFYLALAGLLLLAVSIGRGIESAPSTRHKSGAFQRHAMFALAVLCLLPWAAAAHRLARDYRRESIEQGRVLQAATASMASADLPDSRCQVFLLDLPPAETAIFTATADSAIKALSADLDKVSSCAFQTESTPWFHILRRGAATPESIAPMRENRRFGITEPWMKYGGVEVAYMNLLEDTDARSMTHAVFFAYANGQFEDVSEAVISGKRKVQFHCIRSKDECSKLSRW